MKKIKRIIALFLTVCMIVSTPLSVMATETAAPQSDETFSKVLHLDNGRKYFSKDWIIALVNEMEAAGYNQLQLAFGNDGMRFLLDDMSVTVNGTTYSDDEVTAGIKQGNKNYYDAGEVNELTQAEMTEIVNYAKRKGIEVVPHMNMPGHMDAILDAIEYVGISDAHFTGYTTSARSLNLNNDAAVAFTHALMKKYVAYFDGLGCKYFHIGADEYGNDAYGSSMGFPSMGADLYAKFAKFVNDAAAIVESEGMTPRAWNDGISYGSYTDDFDKKIQITYWSNGWSGYNVAPASTLSGNDHDMINTHGSYYFILTSNGITNPNDSALEFNNNTFMGSTISDPVGSMFCIWCDDPGSATEQEVAAAVRITLRKMAAAMNGTTNYSEEVVSGGFNADGSIAETRAWNTVSPASNSAITVSGYDLTSATATEVAESDLPDVDGAAKIRAWDIIPYVNDTKYTEKGTVSLPVPEDWNTSMLKGFYVENGSAVLVKGTYADGKYTFNMPHFSVAGIAESDYDKLIELNVGESKTELINGVDLTGNTYTPNPANIASVTTAIHRVEGNKTLVEVEGLSDIVSGGKYLIATPNRSVLTADKGSYNGNNNLLALEKNSVDVNNSNVWTITSSENGYTIVSNAGNYLTFDTNTASVTSSATSIAINEGYYGGAFNLRTNGDYLNNFGGADQAAGGWSSYDYNAEWYLYRIDGQETVSGTNVTFTGDSAGTTFVTINNVIYKIVVHGTVDITINYKDASGAVIKTETVTVADNATTYNVSNFNHNGKYYTIEDKTLNLEADKTSYDVVVTETAEDLTQVTPLTIEYWQTNSVVVATQGGEDSSKSINAQDAYLEEGVALSQIIPVTGYKKDGSASDPALGYWRSRLLLVSENEQTGADGDDETLNGTGFTRVRYWNGSWAIYNDAGNWQNISLDDYQLVAYYMNDMNLANEVKISTSDWGKKGNGEYGNTYLGSNNVSLAFQVVYEDGTTAPVDETNASLLAPYTYFVDAWGNRGVGTIAINQIGDYQIWKVSAETGEHGVTHNGNYSPITVNSFTWDNNEMTVWEGNPVDQYTILNPSNDPNTEGYYDNLRWNEINESILIRIYVKAVETEESLQVVYYDEKFDDTLYSYNISVNNDTNFNNGIEGEKEFATDASRIDVSKAYITNALGTNQYFETNLTKVPEAVGKYNSGLYSYTGSKISEDGKTLYLYYNIDTKALSPMFVADYGRSFNFDLSQVVTKGIETVTDVTVNEKTRYGTLEYDADTKVFTYTPTQVLPNVDVLTINIKFAGESVTTTNVGVLPATTVDYEEGFATLTGFTGGSKGTKLQNALVAGTNPDNDVYGYDSKVVTESNTYAKSTAKGNTAEFTFTGTGVDLYVNSEDASGNVAIQVRNADNRLVKVISVKTTSHSTITGSFDNAYQKELIAASVTGLTYGQYSVKITTTDPGTDGVYFDGFRVYGTIQNQANEYYKGDLEDDPTFVELRDYVLGAVDVSANTSADYNDTISKADVYEQILKDVEIGEGQTLTSVVLNNGEWGYTAKELLDNGPKNELFLLPGQSVVFKLTTAREVQVGMKAVNGTAKVTGSYNGTITSERDMFYTVLAKSDEAEKTVTITNDSTSDSILSITKVKICDEPNITFGELEADDLNTALGTLGYKTESSEPTPENPGTPETPVVPEEPGTPDEPTQEPEHECTIEEEIVPATTMKAGKIINKCKECGEVESTKIIYKASNVKLANKEFVYNGKVKAPKLIVKDSKGKVIDKKYYTVTKPAGRKNVGKYTYTIKFKGLYEGTKKLTLTVKPKATAVKSVTASKKAFTVKWKKVSKQATGYEIMYATNAKFSKGKHTVTVKNFKTTSKKISKLKAKQKYYVKVRTYKTVKVNGKNTKIYSNWSKYRTVTTKR